MGDLNAQIAEALSQLSANVNKDAIAAIVKEALAAHSSAANNGAHAIDMKAIADMIDEKLAPLKRQGVSMAHPTVEAIKGQGIAKAITAKTNDATLMELQRAHDRYFVFRALMTQIAKRPVESLVTSEPWKEYEQIARAVYSTGVNVGQDFVFDGFSSQIQQRVDLESKLWGLFPQMNMPQGIEDWALPVLGARGKAYLYGQATGDDARAAAYKASTPGSGKVLLSVVGLASRYAFSREMTEDSAVAVLDWLMSDMVDVFARSREDALINGDTAGTHLDADVTAADDHRKGWDGLRRIAAQIGGASRVDLGTFSESNLLNARLGLGKMGANPADILHVISLRTMIKMLSFPSFITMEKYGPQATVVTGEIAKFYGSPVVLSPMVRDDMDATGVRAAAASTKSGVLLTNPKGFLTLTKRQLGIDTVFDPLIGQTNIVGTERVGFKRVRVASDETPVVYGYNVP